LLYIGGGDNMTIPPFSPFFEYSLGITNPISLYTKQH